MVKQYFWQIVSAILVFILIFTHKKQNSSQIVINTPAKVGVFKSIKPIEVDVPKYIYRTLKGDTIVLEHPVNKELAYRFEDLQRRHDSIQERLVYLESIQIHKYNSIFDNKDLKVIVHSQTTGTLDSLKIDYTIKPDTIKANIPKQRFALFLGGGLYSSNSGLSTKLNLGVQIKDRGIISGGYDVINKNIFLDYNFKIFSLNK